MDLQTLALFFLVTVAVGGVVWVFVYPILSGERKAEQRKETFARPDPAARANPNRNATRSPRAGGRDAEGSGSPPEEAEESADFGAHFPGRARPGRSGKFMHHQRGVSGLSSSSSRSSSPMSA